ncbi:DUF1376 domain-containing protein [Stenotrophomonas sp. MMGLT7]|uniref:DUF1376 domain-containing protein n=1 Tax=Stenotrophomonas sp. MMGLT7 TaxID=2901227 RepID=UPI001E3200B3|nr:DUF1376 domain-containing protein [Stenotrophomonas sp. MMGLT7]MCD7096953.1 YdaU family protein [Stenotrophomonas sp. MMGLT7]
MTSLPEPLVPPEVDLRGMPFMPLDVTRLRDSGFAIESSPEEFRAGILLWCASWNQFPAASLPDNDKVLAAYAGYPGQLRAWARIKAGAMRGFVRCNDGRMYHPVIAEKALEAWAERLDFREMKANDKARKEIERRDRKAMFAKLRALGHVLPYNTPTGKLRELVASAEEQTPSKPKRHRKVTVTGHKQGTVTGHALVTAKTGTGTGTGTGSFKASSSSNNTSADKFQRVAADMARVLRAMGWSDCADGHPLLAQAAAAGLSAKNIQAAAVGKTGKPLAYVVERAAGMKRDAEGKDAATPSSPAVPPEVAEAREALAEVDDRIIAVRHDRDVLHRLEPDEADRQLQGLLEARQELAGHLAQMAGGAS